ncbi:MAG: hypothetical protein LQ350_002445 [Teloschistes chrysophthalmus]|nr:MAG: hypothetical protein LQ350_002445 [Niorma chrysophthalma]
MADNFTKEAFTLLGVGVTVVALRTYARLTSVGIRKFMLDDYLMLLAVVVYGLETGAAYSVGARFHGLANNSMTDEQRRTLSPDSPEYGLRVGGSKLQLIGWSLYTLLLWLLKLCINIFYTRLTIGLQHMRMRTRIGFILIGITYLATVMAILVGCGAPFRKNWQIYPDPGNHCQPAISKMDLFFTVVLNVLTDAYLLSIPLPIFWSARIDPKKKAWLLIMFGGGIFVMMAGILRCALILTAGARGAQQSGSWAVRETFVAVVIGNLPMIHPLFARTITKISSSLSASRSSKPSKMEGSRSISLKAFSKKPRTANPLSVSSSAEQIIEARYKKENVAASRQDPDGNVRAIHVHSQTVVGFNPREERDRHDLEGGQSQCVISAVGDT